MAKQSQAAAARKRVEKLQKIDPNPLLPGGDPTDPRLALEFSENRELPAFPPEAYYLRRYVSLRDALLAYRAESPDTTDADTGNAAEMIPFRKRAVEAILAALGTYPFDYLSAEKILLSWCRARLRPSESITTQAASRNPEVRTAAELWIFVLPLMWAYRTPSEFFRYTVERCYPNDFERLPETLGRLLHTWGYGILLNSAVREALDALSERADSDDLICALGEAEGRVGFRDLGRARIRNMEHLRNEYRALPEGSGVRARWIRERAIQFGVAAKTVERYVRPSSVKRGR